jgi:glycosyltransferase involved in cell wall biosynthesis
MIPPQFAAGLLERPADPLISFVVPVYDEATAVGPFIEATGAVVDRLGVRTEFVFVNDGSRDETLHQLFELQRTDQRIQIVNLSRNFGKEAALSAGLEAARGDVLVPIDVDLQDPPDLLESFLDHWRQGYDVVYGIRRDRSGDPVLKRLTAKAFYRVFNLLSPSPIPENVGDFRLMDRRVVDAVMALPERNRFMKALFSWVGYPSIGVEFDRPERSAGTSSWSIRRLWNFALDGITSFSTVPLRVWTYLGLAMAGGCLLYASVIFVLALSGRIDDVPGYASLLTVILFLGALQLISLGLIGEYLGRVMTEAKQRPLYIVEGTYRPRTATNGEVRAADGEARSVTTEADRADAIGPTIGPGAEGPMIHLGSSQSTEAAPWT